MPGTKLAASEAIRTSHASASERPAPAAGPFTTASTGFSSERIASACRLKLCRETFGDVVRAGAELLKVLADAEAASGAGEHDRANLRPPRLLERCRSPACAARVQGVQHLRPVERDREDGAVLPGLDLGHDSSLNGAATLVWMTIRLVADESQALDAYSRVIVSASERLLPSVAHLRSDRGSGSGVVISRRRLPRSPRPTSSTGADACARRSSTARSATRRSSAPIRSRTSPSCVPRPAPSSPPSSATRATSGSASSSWRWATRAASRLGHARASSPRSAVRCRRVPAASSTT